MVLFFNMKTLDRNYEKKNNKYSSKKYVMSLKGDCLRLSAQSPVAQTLNIAKTRINYPYFMQPYSFTSDSITENSLSHQNTFF